MTPEDAKNILGQLLAGGAALAGLVLVFLGSIVSAYESFEPTSRRAIRLRYRWRVWAAFSGFGGALLSATFALLGLFRGPSPWLGISVALLAASGVVLIVLAFLSAREVR